MNLSTTKKTTILTTHTITGGPVKNIDDLDCLVGAMRAEIPSLSKDALQALSLGQNKELAVQYHSDESGALKALLEAVVTFCNDAYYEIPSGAASILSQNGHDIPRLKRQTEEWLERLS